MRQKEQKGRKKTREATYEIILLDPSDKQKVWLDWMVREKDKKRS